MMPLPQIEATGHTPVPWEIRGEVAARYLGGIGDVLTVRRAGRKDDDRYVALVTFDSMGDGRNDIKTSPEERAANAEFIVRAVNAHAALVAALEAADARLAALGDFGYHKTRKAIATALALASAPDRVGV